MRRRTAKQSMTAASDVNIFSPPSTPSSQMSGSISHREVTENHERKMLLEIVNNIFDDKTGIYSRSSSSCATPERASPKYVCDKRLQYWKDMLEERKRIAEKIQQTVGKMNDDVLFQRRTTVDERDKTMVKRVMDYGDRMNPLKVMNKRFFRLREYYDCKCRNLHELRETLPLPEREKHVAVEVIGMPVIAKKEQLGELEPCKQSSWLQSKFLEERIQKTREDIERVVEFYPDIDNLQVIGESILKNDMAKHNSEIELLQEEVIREISSETQVISDSCKCKMDLPKPEEPISYGIKVNEHLFVSGMKRSAQCVEIEVRFECFPYETVVKRVLHVENIGQKVLNLEFLKRNYYNKVQPLLRSKDEEFIFDCNPFRLISGEKRDIIVMYQPRKVDIVKQQWLLKVEPQFFCRKSDSIILKFSGRCKPPVDYVEKTSSILRQVVEKSNVKMLRKLGTNIGTLAPLIKPDEVICPYRRTLDERELFEQFNYGYKCERYHDLELLKEIYKRLKKPREPAWDLKIETLTDLIMRLESPDRRALVFNEMTGILENMKGTPVELEKKIEESPERERSRFLFVRGIVCTCIDEWEEITVACEEVFVKQAIKLYHIRQEMKQGQGDADYVREEEATSSDILLFDEDADALEELMTKRVRRQKAFRDSLYVQTYTHLCNFIEDMVSIIESTEIV